MFSVKYMSVIRLEINETIVNKYTGEKILITCKCDSLLELKQFSVLSWLLRKFQLKTSLNYSHLKYSLCALPDPRDGWRIFEWEDRKYNVLSQFSITWFKPVYVTSWEMSALSLISTIDWGFRFVRFERITKRFQRHWIYANMRPYLQILVRLVRHLKELVSLRLKKNWIRQTRIEQPRVVCCFHFFYITKINLKNHTWKLNEHYLKINEDWENNSEV